MAHNLEEELDVLLGEELNLDNLGEEPQPNDEEASASSNHSTDNEDDNPGAPGLEERDLGDSSDEEEEPPDPSNMSREEAERLFTEAVLNNLRQNKQPKKPKDPLMGEVITVDGKRLIRMGGVPNCKWTRLISKSKMHPNQFRSVDPTKHYKVGYGLKALEPAWTKQTKLSVLQNHIHQHLVASGMEQHEYLPDPHKPTRMVNVILKPHLFARDLEATTNSVKSIAKCYDGYDQGNDQLAHKFLLDCLDSELNEKVGGLDHSDDLFLVTWIKVVRNWTILTRERAQAIKKQVQDYRIQQVPGMDLSVAAAYLLPRLNALKETREIDPVDLLGFLKSLHGVYPVESEHHLPWWTEINGEIIKPLKDACDKAKLEMRKGPCEVEEFLIKATKDGTKHKGLDYKSILETLEVKYDKAYHSEEWPAAKDPVDSKAAPTTFDATAVHHTGVRSNQPCTKADVMALMQNFDKLRSNNRDKPKFSKADKTCHACGQKGHFARDPECPKNKAHVDNKTPQTSNQRKKFKKEKTNWKHIPPKDGEPKSKTRDGKLWHWCSKCSNSRGRWTSSHTSEEHGKKPAGGPTANVVTLDTSPCAWHTSLPTEHSWLELMKDMGSVLFAPLLMMLCSYIVLFVMHCNNLSIASALHSHLETVASCASGFWTALATMAPHLLDLLHQAIQDHPLMCWIINSLWLLGITHALWQGPSQPPDPWRLEPKLPRREQRLKDKHLKRLTTPRFKGASIKDRNFSKHYPRRLRTERRFWTRAPTHDERHKWTEFFGDWFEKNGRPSPTKGHKGAWTEGRWKHKSRGALPKPRKAPPFRVQRSHRGFEARFNPVRTKQCQNQSRKCWTCGNTGHTAKQCELGRRNSTHSRPKCVNHKGRSSCIDPTSCPFAKPNHSPDWKHWHRTVNCCQRVKPEGSFTPSQEELDRVASAAARLGQENHNPHRLAEEVMAFCVALDPTFIEAALCAPHKVKDAMPPDGSFKIIWDSGATHSITNDSKDFIGPIRSVGVCKTLTGLARGLMITGVGTVGWTVLDINGKPRTLKVEAHLVPKSPVKLMSTAQLLQAYTGETISLDDQSATLSGIAGDPERPPVKAFVNPCNNIPDCTAFKMEELEKAALALNTMVTTVDPRNINLSEPQKELL